MAGRVEDPVDLELGGVAGFEVLDAGEDPEGSAGDGAGEVGGSGVEGEVLAPGAALLERLLGEEVLGGGGELVEVLGFDRDLEVLVRVVEARAVGFVWLLLIGSVVVRRHEGEREREIRVFDGRRRERERERWPRNV